MGTKHQELFLETSQEQNDWLSDYAQVFNTPFATRVSKMWETFVEKEEQLRKLLDKKDESGAVAKVTSTILGIALADPIFEIGYNDKSSRYELILSADGLQARAYSLIYIKQLMPESLQDQWMLTLGRQHFDVGIRMHGRDLSASDIDCTISREEESDIHTIVAYNPILAELLQEDENAAYQIFLILLDNTLGEARSIKYQGEVRIVDSCPEGAIKMRDLPRAIQSSLGLSDEDWAKVSDLSAVVNGWSSYSLRPSEEEDAPLRADIITLSSNSASLLNDSFEDEPKFPEEFAESGILTASFVLSIDADLSEQLELRNTLWDRIEANEQSSILIFGAALGTQHAYIDCLLWDATNAITYIKSIAREFPELRHISLMPWGEELEPLTIYSA